MPSLFSKIWNEHVVAQRDDGSALLYIDRQLLHEVSSPHPFEELHATGRRLRRPGAMLAVQDHNVPTTPDRLDRVADEESATQIRLLRENTRAAGIRLFDLDDERQGIVHVIGPENGFVQPGITLVCGDSHTATLGAFGAIAFGVGASEVGHVLATQTLWQQRPREMRITADGALASGVAAKDLILAIIAKIGASGGSGHAIEYAGSTIAGFTMEQRMTVSNMSIEAGARFGLIAPDAVTVEYLRGRPYAPAARDWDAAVAFWRSLAGDADARFDREVRIDAGALAPHVTWGTSPQDALPIDAAVPDPDAAPDAAERARRRRALDYMGLAPGTVLRDIRVDRVFIGSCTNSRIEDLRTAAAIARGRKVAAGVQAMVVPGSGLVRRQAEAEGLDRVFAAAGFEWRLPGCSMCVAMNPDRLAPGERCASTSNRNFEGRQGKGGRTHLMSPAMAAAAAVTGRLTDVRELLR
ncbi:MAG: 3-isopropylmalate dehydratase large subunit [Gemmatimonadota bacterium]